MSERCYHGVTPAEECTECIEPESSLGYAQGRADERADVVAWLRGTSWADALIADIIERGEHVDAAKVKP